MTIVENTRLITGGVDTHADVHVAAAVDGNGGVLGVESFATTPVGVRDLYAWLTGFGCLERVLLSTYAHLMPADHDRARTAVQLAFTRSIEDSVRTETAT